MGRVTSNVIRGISVTQFIGAGHIPSPISTVLGRGLLGIPNFVLTLVVDVQ